MQISNFEGIQQYHDGRPVADYCNMIPLGTSVIDRYGELEACYDDDLSNTDVVLETFVDSDRNLYVARGHSLQRYQFSGDKFLRIEMMTSENLWTNATFCESSTKPGQVYFCNGRDVYYWNIQSIDVAVDTGYENRVAAFTPFKIPLFKDLDSLRIDGYTVADYIKDYGYTTNDDITATRYGWWPETGYTGGDPMSVWSIAWFDNRLVLVERVNNTVWLSAVDPSRFLKPALMTGNGYGVPMYPWQIMSSEEPNRAINAFMPNYYASTASAATLQDVVTFAGQLYFLNDLTIEVWSATGNDSNPIQHNSQNTLYYGGKSPVIIDDTLYLICRGAIHNDFIAAINQAGNITHVSNLEIERRFGGGAYRLRPLAVRDQSMVVAYTDDSYSEGYAVTRENRWWRYWNGKAQGCIWSIINYNGLQIGITKYGRLVQADESSRTTVGHEPILRSICGGFMQLASRKILREVEVVCDTGIYMDARSERGKLYLRVSFDRGAHFGPYLYRSMGANQNNDRVMLWRNCGSGNSILLDFGTADDVRFQVYGLRFELS